MRRETRGARGSYHCDLLRYLEKVLMQSKASIILGLHDTLWFALYTKRSVIVRRSKVALFQSRQPLSRIPAVYPQSNE
jgi:hypothetical protein